jgi:alpha-L-fucosidase
MNNPLSRRSFIKKSALFTGAAASLPLIPGLAQDASPSASPTPHPLPPPPTPIDAPPGFGVAEGPFQPTFESLAAGFQVPDWFRDAKFGIWAHWGPQSQPEQGDWYAKNMYRYGHEVYKFHVQKYGHPSKFGFKDVINTWKAEDWDPAHLIGLYKRAGAKYFATMAHHHDNFDNFNSTYQPWNAVACGPKKDIVGGWAKAARDAGLRLAITSHGDRAWSWYQEAQGSDPTGPMAGVTYDGIMTRDQGKGLWWEGLDPQDLYAQYHTVGKYDWPQHGNPPLAKPFIDKFFYRIVDLIDKYQPDLLYFDDTILPIYPVSDIGPRIAAYLYNTNYKRNGKLEAIVTGKGLHPEQRRALLLDVERGVTNNIEALPWQTDTCIGSWHYKRALFDNHGYKTSKQVSQMLVDIVSKNGNLQLNIPLPGHGVPDADELAFLSDFTSWMDVNNEGIYASRPWKIYGEGPSVTSPLVKGPFGGARDIRPYVAEDIRFTTKGDTLYAFVMDIPASRATLIKGLASTSPHLDGRKLADVSLLGHSGKLVWTQDTQGLSVKLPDPLPSPNPITLKIRGALT